LLTDAASLKARTTAEVTERLRTGGLDAARFVGGHPMAGSERSGLGAVQPELFQGATWVLTPTAATADATLSRVAAFLRTLGARVVALTPAQHDELVAVVSHLPQVVASTLAAVAADAIERTGDAVLAVAGGGFRDTTRIAASDPRLWIEILAGNREAVLDSLDAYTAILAGVRSAVDREDWPALEGLLARAATARQRLVPKATPAAVADLVVPLDDRPGQLATATTALGAAGINVEDLALRHAGAGGRGALLLQVAEEDRARALEVLHAAGLAVHVEPAT
ncbi:MAG: prephenate dehydrogenase, partial [Nitriliruptoraceae bacterium]